MKNIILEAKNICKSFANEGVQTHVLSDLDISVYEGDFTVIMGASGSGKSTLLYALSGMDRPDAGDVLYRGENITGYKESKMSKIRTTEFGFIFQQMHLVSNLSIFENVVVPAYRNSNYTAKEAKERALMLLQKVNITEVKDRLPSQVSGGEAQRGAIARAVVNKPGLLFADEPTGALNRRNTKDVLELLSSLNEEGQSILMVTHDVNAAVYATRIIYLEDGNISGELTLPPYEKEQEKSRKTQIDAWLKSMQW